MKQKAVALICFALSVMTAKGEAAPQAHVCDAVCDHFAAGLKATESGDFAAVIREFTVVIDLKPEPTRLSVALINRGRARLMIGDSDAALLDFDGAVTADPKSAEAMGWRALAYFKKGEKEMAIQAATRAIELDPTYVAAYSTRGSSYGSLKEFGGAIADYSRALELDPKYFPALLGRAIARRSVRDLKGAISDLQAALQIQPDFARGKKMLEELQSEEAQPNQRPDGTSAKALPSNPSQGAAVPHP